MLLLRGATLFFRRVPPNPVGFNTCSSCEEQPKALNALLGGNRCFNTCSSCEEQLRRPCGECEQNVSIHAPLARSNSDTGICAGRMNRFNTCSSCEEQPEAVGEVRKSEGFNTCSSCEEQQEMRKMQESDQEFQYMLLLRGATTAVIRARRSTGFQYMLLLRGATCDCKKELCQDQGFNTCSSCEEQRRARAPGRVQRQFQYMLLLRGATSVFPEAHILIPVSIHAPLARSNVLVFMFKNLVFPFQYMLLLRGATCFFRKIERSDCFNTCSSCEEQREPRFGQKLSDVSIHAPLARSNSRKPVTISLLIAFQYMLLLRGATLRKRHASWCFMVSIHAPLARSNMGACFEIFVAGLFQYMLLLRGATALTKVRMDNLPVSIHAPLARSNKHPCKSTRLPPVSIHAPLARSNSRVISSIRSALRFNTCSSCEEQRRRRPSKSNFSVSIHAPLARSNLMHSRKRSVTSWFQYMLLLRGATRRHLRIQKTPHVSIHAPLARSNRRRCAREDRLKVSIHAPLARSNTPCSTDVLRHVVSIHAPLARSNTMKIA